MRPHPQTPQCRPSYSHAAQFSENKNIAGFDNPGKSLYTTIREVRMHLCHT